MSQLCPRSTTTTISRRGDRWLRRCVVLAWHGYNKKRDRRVFQALSHPLKYHARTAYASSATGAGTGATGASAAPAAVPIANWRFVSAMSALLMPAGLAEPKGDGRPALGGDEADPCDAMGLKVPPVCSIAAAGLLGTGVTGSGDRMGRPMSK